MARLPILLVLPSLLLLACGDPGAAGDDDVGRPDSGEIGDPDGGGPDGPGGDPDGPGGDPDGGDPDGPGIDPDGGPDGGDPDGPGSDPDGGDPDGGSPDGPDGGGPDGGSPDGGGVDAPAGPPETMFTVTPDAHSNQAPARFEFTADRPATFRCAADNGPELDCTSPHTVPAADGVHSFDVRAVGLDGVADPSPARHVWTVDTVAPETVLTLVPPALDNSATVQFHFVSFEPATFICALDNGAATPCTSPHQLTGLTDGTHRFVVTARDSAGNIDASPAVREWTIDTSSPDTVIDSGPSGAVATRDASFTFSSPDAGPGAHFECSRNGAPFAACTSPRNFTQLPLGNHTFRVRVIDATGNVDPTPAQRQWTVDLTTPSATVAGPSSPTRDNTPTFTFTLFDAPTTVECRFDTDAFAPCTSPHEPVTPLADGGHTFEIYVADDAGNNSTAARPFVVDTTAPVVTIAAAPDLTNDATPTHSFTVTGDATSVGCRYDTAAFAPCTSPFTPSMLADGAHTLEVRALDAAGNAGTATRAITIDTMAPIATILSGPAEGSLINDPTPTFTFAVSGDPISIRCRTTSMLTAEPCDPAVPFETPWPMANGDAAFFVTVRDAAGNAAVGVRSFRVDSTPPTVWLVGPSDGAVVHTRTPSWTVGADADASDVACRIDNAPFGPCTTPTSYTAPTLADGPHTVAARARDLAGNESFATKQFVVAGPAN